ncbi:hypothetical protein ASF04_24000 [Duganella sp. Leaf61]|uniref:hypothetical protein n=1 Tax=Duganella sp. Leaf61 TaxID=1736227 RepID=UPI0006F51BDB|nr:hypothetical protein [Duganella sp. Leaf61]KQN77833.1 hypothetical protein ASF04_24000 [Duganella sp. Leaf61]
MRVRILRRREGGAYLPEPLRVGCTPAPFELLVVEVTDQGKRRPSKVARLYAPGTKSIVAELASVQLLWLKGFEFVLHGVDIIANERGPVHAAQSWMCKLDEPLHVVGYRMRGIYDRGLELPRRQLMDRPSYVSEGKLRIGGAMDERLGRNATRAEFTNASRHVGTLLDCELEWMSEERFQLSGFQHYDAYGDDPARLLRQGWLIDFDIKTPEQVAYVRSVQKGLQGGGDRR